MHARARPGEASVDFVRRPFNVELKLGVSFLVDFILPNHRLAYRKANTQNENYQRQKPCETFGLAAPMGRQYFYKCRDW
ncbi:MAG: hypothetical protein WCG50_10350 [Rhodoferax sp.]|uniref:hypothetical protein n=1 Tax=Rhodoferax sp. TaxID=50421 RepID=UPI0030161828